MAHTQVMTARWPIGTRAKRMQLQYEGSDGEPNSVA